MQRREFITLIGSTAVTQVILPQLACAQVSTKRHSLLFWAGSLERNSPLPLWKACENWATSKAAISMLLIALPMAIWSQFPALAEELIRLHQK